MKNVFFAVLLTLSQLSSAGATQREDAAPVTTPPAPRQAADTGWFASPSGPTPVMKRVEGDRTKHERFLEYYRTPAGTSLGAHRHTADMQIKVIEGSQFILMGDLEESRVRRFDAGSTFVIPAGVWHVEWFESDTFVEISGIGPMRTERPPVTPRLRQPPKP